MDRKREKTHWMILNSRVKSLGGELEAALKISKITDERIKALQDGLNTIHSNRRDRIQEIETKFETEIADYNRQIQLARDVLNKKVEERQALMSYLTGLDLNERSIEDLRDFEWDTLQRVAENLHKPREDLIIQNQKAEVLKELTQETKQLLTSLNSMHISTSLIKDRFFDSFEGFKEQSDLWLSTRSRQETRIDKLQRDNERLNVLLRQCMTANEHMTDYITKNVQAKCQSFLNCESPYELMEGLKKFKGRQDKVIRLLRHKDDHLGAETNKLEVAKDQTHDQMKFYLNLIANRRDGHLTRILGSQRLCQLQNAAGA